jgi:drug/metabolite transporter (DMT)-like permease
LAFTLQLIGQRKANPSHAAIILSTESVFAAIGGWIILNEELTQIEIIGAGLMLSGVVLSQLKKRI